MPCLFPAPSQEPEVLYPFIERVLDDVTAGETDPVANLANAAATLGFYLPRINWAGFYLAVSESELLLGPFWGKPAVSRIAVGSGVCGTSAARRETVVVPDVHQFPGHIACDLLSNSEIVVPLLRDGTLLGVLDIDSPDLDRFTQKDREALERIAERIAALLGRSGRSD